MIFRKKDGDADLFGSVTKRNGMERNSCFFFLLLSAQSLISFTDRVSIFFGDESKLIN